MKGVNSRPTVSKQNTLYQKFVDHVENQTEDAIVKVGGSNKKLEAKFDGKQIDADLKLFLERFQNSQHKP